MAAPKKKARPPRAKPRRATQREFHARWIELSTLGKQYAIWKIDDILNVGEINSFDGLPTDMPVEYEIPAANFLAAVDEMTGRKKNRGADDEPYGDPVEFGDGFALEKYDQREYAIRAPCGETLDISATELRLLATAIRELPPTIGP